MNATTPDRRLTRRLGLRIPMRLRKCECVESERTAESVDLSERGVLLKTEVALEVGTELELHLKIPEEVTGMPGMEWCCMGRVVHVKRDMSSNVTRTAGVHFSRLQMLRASNCA
jgi:hypothetical protein